MGSGKSTREQRVDKDKEIRELNERLTNAQVLLDQSRRTNLAHEAEILHLQQEVGVNFSAFPLESASFHHSF